MMDELEAQLKRARRAAPSAELDRRLEAAFAAARRRRSASHRGAFWWSTAIVATLGAAAALVLVASHRPVPAPTVAVYHIEAEGRLRDMLLNPTAPREIAPQFVVHIDTP